LGMGFKRLWKRPEFGSQKREDPFERQATAKVDMRLWEGEFECWSNIGKIH